MSLFGIETEYGIAVEGKDASDLVVESRAVVNAYRGKFAKPWYYRGEDSRNDMRGFHVSKLNYDPEDAKFDDPKATPLPAEVERADHVLVNGARLYNDHGHPEYATPECAGLIDLVTHDKAGERIVLECARLRSEQQGVGRVSIYKNNTDYHGSSYGCHESYLTTRARPFGELLSGLLPFFVTRILYAGAGKLGIEPKGSRGVYQISQRADFFTEEASVDTLHRRPIVNTRDEPHADPRQWRRLHVICGDANLSEYATALKAGTTALVVALLEKNWSPGLRLRQPVQAIKDVSRDQTSKWLVETDAGKTIGGVDLQRIYWEAASKQFVGSSADADWTLREWGATLDALAHDPMQLSDKIDWVAKKSLLTDFAESEGIAWDDDQLLSIDLAYSNVDPDEGLYYALEQSGEMVRLTTDAAIEAAMTAAPQDTRAALRGELVSRFADHIGAVGWGKRRFARGQRIVACRPRRLSLAGARARGIDDHPLGEQSHRAACNVPDAGTRMITGTQTESLFGNNIQDLWNSGKGNTIMPTTDEERATRPGPADPMRKDGEEGGPSKPDVQRPDRSDLLKRMKRVDPDQARRYRQRSGQ